MQLLQAFFREVPNLIQLFDYDVRTDGQPVYLGYAPSDTEQSEHGWVIFYFQYNDSGNVTSIQSTRGIWTIRDELFS